jgi:uncharacterized membrane protein
MIAPAAVRRTARLGWLHFEGGWLAFLGYAATPYVLSLPAIGELIAGKLPKTPSRKAPPGFIPRIAAGALCGAAVAGLLAGLLGAIAGTLGGYECRVRLVRATGGKAGRSAGGRRRHRWSVLHRLALVGRRRPPSAGPDCVSVLAEMRRSRVFRIGVPIAALCLCIYGQETPGKDQQSQSKGMPPRATPSDYQAHAQAGAVTVAAEFVGHSVPTMEGTYSSEDYVVVETGLFGPPDTRLKLAGDDFSLRINGKKTLPSQPYGLVTGSLKDPEWEPPASSGSKSKTGLSTGGGQGDSGPAPPPKMPIELQRTMWQHVQKASFPEGERPLPQAGLLFFQYRGKAKSIQSVELIYAGPAGKISLALQP